MVIAVIDGMGGDDAPRAVVEGVIMASNEYKDICIYITGPQDKLEEELTKYILQEMALSKKALISKLLDLAPVVIEHLILIMLYPENNELNHWKGEIKGNSSKYYKLKQSNKYPTYDDLSGDYLQTIYETVDDQLVYYIDEAYRKESENLPKYISIKNIKLDKMKELIKTYFTTICKNIDKNTGIVDSNLIYKLLDDIITEYNK